MAERVSDAIPKDVENFFEKYSSGMSVLLEGAQANTGQTPKEVVWTKNKARLYRYEPSAEKKHPVPILMVYALINRPYVLDLLPGNSFIEYLTGEGFDVYLLDWGTPGDEDKDLDVEHYILDYLPRAVKKVLRTSGAEEFTLFGYCMGGTMAAMYAALFPDKPLKNLVLLAAPIDFSPENSDLYGIWFDEKYQDPDVIMETFGNVPAPLAYTGTAMLRPLTNYVGSYVMMWDLLMKEKPMDG